MGFRGEVAQQQSRVPDVRFGSKADIAAHDLRRAVRTGIDQLGTPPHICEAVLNHLPPKLVRTYNLNTYENEKRKALSAWAHHLKTIVAQATGANVAALKRKQQ